MSVDRETTNYPGIRMALEPDRRGTSRRTFLKKAGGLVVAGTVVVAGGKVARPLMSAIDAAGKAAANLAEGDRSTKKLAGLPAGPLNMTVIDGEPDTNREVTLSYPDSFDGANQNPLLVDTIDLKETNGIRTFNPDINALKNPNSEPGEIVDDCIVRIANKQFPLGSTVRVYDNADFAQGDGSRELQLNTNHFGIPVLVRKEDGTLAERLALADFNQVQASFLGFTDLPFEDPRKQK